MSKWAWCLVNDDKTLVTGWQKIGDFWYCLNTNGTMVTGWYKDANSKWYYLNESGQMTTGWIQLNDKYYYLYESTDATKGEYIGTTAYSCTKRIADKKYTFDADGVMQVGSSSLLSDSGAEFIGGWEGLSLEAYEDPYYPGNSDWWTIGYGTTNKVTPSAFPNGLGSICTKTQAIEWLKEEAEGCATTIKNVLAAAGVILTQNELDACISFAYNCGTGGLTGSTFWKNVIAGVKNSDTITSNLQAWSKANGVTSAGLLKRRNAEAALFLNADYTGNC
jgi:lysozyme